MTEEQFEKAKEIRDRITSMEENRKSSAIETAPRTYLGIGIEKETAADWRAINEAFWTEQIEKEKKKLAEL